jgi:hypothetical protein
MNCVLQGEIFLGFSVVTADSNSITDTVYIEFTQRWN